MEEAMCKAKVAEKNLNYHHCQDLINFTQDESPYNLEIQKIQSPFKGAN